MAFPPRLDDAALVPPLELAGGDAGEGNHFAGCKTILHDSPTMFKTNYGLNVSNILGAFGCESSEDTVEKG
jgi:hypothetical protein